MATLIIAANFIKHVLYALFQLIHVLELLKHPCIIHFAAGTNYGKGRHIVAATHGHTV